MTCCGRKHRGKSSIQSVNFVMWNVTTAKQRQDERSITVLLTVRHVLDLARFKILKVETEAAGWWNRHISVCCALMVIFFRHCKNKTVNLSFLVCGLSHFLN